jgi:uncharacterized protein (DUF2062 family)
MVFRRRIPLTLPQKLRATVLPPGGWRRAFAYLRLRLTRISDAPHRVARGIACGVFVGCTPFFGLHLPLAAALAWVFRGNLVAALIGTAAGNPVTIPILAVLSLELGRRLLGIGSEAPFSQIMTEFGQAGEEISYNLRALVTSDKMQWDKLLQFLHEVFLPYLVGGIGPALLAALASYWISLPALEAYQNRRSKRREGRDAARKSSEPDGEDRR